ncbi:hypothetical protein GJ496_005410 [Pomphorhynchus laevis]|nr:hypothetical protein GJ496_005410 [Pomphorhynchus laevis]
MTRQTILGSFKPSLNVFDDGSQFVNGFSGIGGVQLTTDFLGKRNQNLSTVAVFPINDKVQIDHFTESLANALQSYGSVIRLTRQSILDRLGSSALASINEHRLLAWLSQQEEQHRLVIYQCSSKFNTWSRRCVRQADCVLAVGIFWTSPEVTNIERKIQEHSVRAQKELVLLHDLKDGRHPRGTANWLRTRTWCSSHHHIRCPSYFFTDPISCSTSRSSMDILMSSIYTKHNTSSSASEISDSTSVCDKMGDMHRLARFLTGRSVGLALGGGGAKGIAHIGIIEAMMDKKIPIDLVGGTSIGSFVGGLFASRLCVDYCSYQTKRLSDVSRLYYRSIFIWLY